MPIRPKKHFSPAFIFILLCLNSICLTADAEKIYKDITLKANKKISIPISDSLFNSKKVLLSFSARVNSQNRYKSGGAAALVVTVNNIPVDIDRLKNKRKFYVFNRVNKVKWFWDSKGWAVTYYPWDKAHTVAGGQVHKYVFDIKNLLKKNQNKIILKNTLDAVRGAYLEIKDIQILTNDSFPRSPLLINDAPMCESQGLARFRNLASGYHEGINVKLNTSIDYVPNAIKNVSPRKNFSQNYKLTVDKKGKLQVELKGEKYNFVSYFRTPGGAWRSVGKQNSAANWAKYNVSNKKIICENNKLILTRTICKRDSHIIVKDSFKNKTSKNLPVVIMNTVDFLKLNELSEFRIAGNKQSHFYSNTTTMESRTTGVTPVAYVARKNSGLGIVIQDDVYRNQASYLAWGSTLGVGNDLFYLAPRGKYTMEWKIFPIQEKSYYQFVNAIRRDWGFSREIPGLFGFVHPFSNKHHLYEDAKHKTPEAIAKFINDTGLNIPSTLAMLPKAGKPFGLTGNENLQQIREGTKSFREWRDKAKQAGCKIKALPYLDVHLVKPYFDKGLKNVDKRLPGSLIKDAYDKFVPYSTGEQWLVLPALDNACGKHLMNVLKLLLDEQKFDGLYLDEWDHSRARVSFNHFDGYSAIINKNAELVRKIGFVPLLTRDFQKKFVEEVIKRGKIVFANQFDGTMSSAKLPVIHFGEPLGSYDYKLFAAQLTATPLSLHVARTRSVWQDVKEFLKRGVLTCYYFKYFHGDHVLKKCFPITVKEVWPGYIVGKKKIVTMSSGRYSFDRDKALTAFIYSGSKALLHSKITSAQRADGKHEISLKLTSDQVAVIVEKQ